MIDKFINWVSSINLEEYIKKINEINVMLSPKRKLLLLDNVLYLLYYNIVDLFIQLIK